MLKSELQEAYDELAEEYKSTESKRYHVAGKNEELNKDLGKANAKIAQLEHMISGVNVALNGYLAANTEVMPQMSNQCESCGAHHYGENVEILDDPNLRFVSFILRSLMPPEPERRRSIMNGMY